MLSMIFFADTFSYRQKFRILITIQKLLIFYRRGIEFSGYVIHSLHEIGMSFSLRIIKFGFKTGGGHLDEGMLETIPMALQFFCLLDSICCSL